MEVEISQRALVVMMVMAIFVGGAGLFENLLAGKRGDPTMVIVCGGGIVVNALALAAYIVSIST